MVTRMKKILITGKNSYIGTSFEKWMSQFPDDYAVDTIDMRDVSWRIHDFSKYDVVFHVAGIAHVKETKDNRLMYFNINRDLAYETAQKAKSEGVKQFIFLSTMSVYGIDKGIINENIPLQPNTSYGKSKFEAEQLINKLNDEAFSVAILRPPMVYGKNCKGNYQRLAELACNTPIFPMVDNKRSMIYIDNLAGFVKVIIDKKSGGLYFPQNNEYVNTSDLVKLIAKVHGKRVIMTKVFNPILKLLNFSVVNKVFCDLIYDKSLSDYESGYILYGLSDSIELTEE